MTDLVESVRFAASYVDVELRQVLSNRWRRRTTYVWLTLLAEGALIGAGIGWLTHHLGPGILIGSTVGLLAGPTASFIGETRGYHHAIWRQHHTSPTHRYGAYATQRNDHWHVYSVHAHPTGAGHGHQLMADLIAAADDHHMPLSLDASSPDAVRFYQRHGFIVTTGTRVGATPMIKAGATY